MEQCAKQFMEQRQNFVGRLAEVELYLEELVTKSRMTAK